MDSGWRDGSIELLLAAPTHRYEGRPADGPLPATTPETPDAIELRAGLGVVGDRYYASRAHRLASVTLIAAESLDAVAAELDAGPLDPVHARRNVVLRGLDVDALPRGTAVTLDTGDGPVVLRVHRPANPCAWMDTVYAPGAFRLLRGRGGVRCEPLTDGTLRLGPVRIRVEIPDAAAGTANPPGRAAAAGTPSSATAGGTRV